MKNPPDNRLLPWHDQQLMHVVLEHRLWKGTQDNDHDHCAFCWDKFADYEGCLHEGYCTSDMRHWICPTCYADFHTRFGWTAAAAHQACPTDRKPLITGIHHVSLKCRKGDEYRRVLHFYTEVLGLSIARTWGKEQPDGVLLDTGNGFIEIFTNRSADMEAGVIRHVALCTADVEACVSRVKAAGYEVFVEPRDLLIPSEPPVCARIAFCFGPLQEQIEFFQPC